MHEHLKATPDIEFHFEPPINSVVRLTKIYPEGQFPTESSSAISMGTITGEVDDNFAAELATAISNSKDGKWVNFGGIEQSRMVLIWAAIDKFFLPLRKLVESTVMVLLWRGGLSKSLTDFIRNRKEFLSLNGKDWLEVSMVRGLAIKFIPTPRQLATSPELATDVVGFVISGSEEPLGHQLFREAWNQRLQHPRSALVIGVAAAEVGLKKLITTLAPETQWLVDEIQLPPLSKMLRKYLPTLPVKAMFAGKTIRPPARLIKLLESAAEHRNKVVHAGKEAPVANELEEMLNAVDEFLWICDAYAGYRWVAGYISAETVSAWENG